MLSVVFAAAASAAEAPSEGPAGLLHKFGVEWQFVIWQFVSFALLATILYQFAIKPILAAVDERNAKIVEGLKNAAATAAKLAQAQLDAAAIAKQAQLEGSRLVEEARKTANEFLAAQQSEATARANDLVAKARQALALEHKKMLEEARLEVTRLVVTTTERVLARELSDAERARYNEAAAHELTQIEG